MPTNLPHDRAAEGRLLTVPKVRERLDCSRSFVYLLIQRGMLKTIRLGDIKGIRVTEKSVERYLRKRERQEREKEDVSEVLNR